jgi:hypothetical protein
VINKNQREPKSLRVDGSSLVFGKIGVYNEMDGEVCTAGLLLAATKEKILFFIGLAINP